MKKLLYSSLFLFSLFLASGCQLLESDEFVLNDPIELPEVAANFITTNFPDFAIRGQDGEDLCDNTDVLKVELEDGPGPDIDLYFTLAGEFLFSATDIMSDELPQAVRATIDSAFATYVIDASSVERFDYPDGSVQYEVELIDANGEDHDLVIAPDGAIICWEADFPDDDDDDDDNDGRDSLFTTLPDSVRTFISNTYGGYRVDDVAREDLCDDEYFFEVELEDGPGPDIDLYFSLDWVFRFSASDISADQIPVTVSDAVATDFPGYQIVAGKAERLNYPNGDVAYLLEIENADGRDRDVVYDSSGTLKCDDDDDSDDDDDDDSDDDDDDSDDDDDDDRNVTLPDSIRAYVSSLYAGYRIDGVERDDLCDDQYYFKVELEDGPGGDIDLYFDLGWQLSFTATEIDAAALPSAVMTTLANDFPGAQIDGDDIERLDFPDGSVQYYLEVATSGDDYDLVYTAAGVLVCSDRN